MGAAQTMEIALCHEVMKFWEMTMTLQATKANQGEHWWDSDTVAKKCLNTSVIIIVTGCVASHWLDKDVRLYIAAPVSPLNSAAISVNGNISDLSLCKSECHLLPRGTRAGSPPNVYV